MDETNRQLIDAFSYIRQICEGSQGNWAYHQQVQQALLIVANALQKLIDQKTETP